MKLAISNIAWSAENDDLMYSFLKSEDFEGLEIAPTRLFPDNAYDHLKEAKDFKQHILQRYKLSIPSMQAICFGRHEAIFGTEEERNNIKGYIQKAIDFASVLECRNLVFGSPKNRIIGEGQESTALSFFGDLAVYAASKKTVLAIEPNPEIYGTNFLNTTTQAINFSKEVNNKGLKVNVDLGTIIYNDESLDVIADNIDLINHIHVSEPYLEPIQERVIHTDLYRLLNEYKYKNFVSIEMKNTNDISIVSNAIHYLKDVFKRT